MREKHAHHILFKRGNGPDQQRLVEKGQAILRKHGIDPIFGEENLVWAPNIAGQHDRLSLEVVVEELERVDRVFGEREDIVDALVRMGEIAAGRTNG